MFKALVISVSLIQQVHMGCLEYSYVTDTLLKVGEIPILAGLDKIDGKSISFEVWYDSSDKSWTMFRRVNKKWACAITSGFGLITSTIVPRRKADDGE